ncbi:MBL fold metallo-hydrolase [Pseudomarimonas arenosa]|uniref:MBL fold metallo-hydrolase n=1 Tax=Pseudomarimonas arenosa TaxID=2774145 RepID=A0AAW3ZNW3_9GAMM|nr:MBL fold metallo-hydrolase [Pseudomarimonas arenosa]MBD8526031.1 MBL fold metallo-hydrolase [Pseudomarimonas arenosa]
MSAGTIHDEISRYALRFLGVGSSQAVELGSPSAVLERDGRPLLMIDCGGEALTAYLAHYSGLPPAIFITHTHFDHIGGMERLFFRSYFDPELRGQLRLFVPASVVPWLQGRVADYPGVLAEGGVNYWDAFQLVPCNRGFWWQGLWFEIFPTRHHQPGTSYGLALTGSFVFSGDTRPIPELLEQRPGQELVCHDCGLVGNPSHTGIDDIEREYSIDLRQRLLLYHYGSAADGESLRQRGYRVATAGAAFALRSPVEDHLPLPLSQSSTEQGSHE